MKEDTERNQKNTRNSEDEKNIQGKEEKGLKEIRMVRKRKSEMYKPENWKKGDNSE